MTILASDAMGNPILQADQPESVATNEGTTNQASTGWFSSMFGWIWKGPGTIENSGSNAVDVPPNGGSGTSIWSKYGLDFGTPAAASTVTSPTSSLPATDQSWFSRIWSGVKGTTQFVFCPIFTECPAPLPPGGISLSSGAQSVGQATGNAIASALSPLLPMLLILVVGLVLVNAIIGKVTAVGAASSS